MIDGSGSEENVVTVEDHRRDRAPTDGRTRRFPCHRCGADLNWEPGVDALSCPYCGHREEPPRDQRSIEEYPFNELLHLDGKRQGLADALREAKCGGCGAVVELAETVVVRDCPFCGGSVAEAERQADEIRPEAVLPFRVVGAEADRHLRRWIARLWFAPSNLEREASRERFQGVYRYWWTFDSQTVSHWSGSAGYHYHTGTGKNRRRRTRWVSRSGTYQAFFDDQLVPGFRRGLETTGFDLRQLVPYTDQILAGFVAERYEIDPQEGWSEARSRIERQIAKECRKRLGGDTQRGFHCRTAHSGIAFKGVLLPVWIGTYRYGKKVYRVTVNGQNGAVTAERPWSRIKIAMAVLAALAVVFAIVAIVQSA